MKQHSTIPKPEHGSVEWLAARWKNEQGLALISASVAAAVHDEHPYTTSSDLAAELLAPEAPQPKQSNQAMERGTRMEPFIREWAQEQYQMQITEPRVMYTYEEDGVRLIATLDGMTQDLIPVEIKTTAKRWEGQLPTQWYWQGVQQAICANVSTIEWVIFDATMQMHRYTQNVTSDEMQMHIQACRNFLADIDLGIMPLGSPIKGEHAQQIHPIADGSVVELDKDGYQAVVELKAIRTVLKEYEAKESELKGQVGMLLGDSEKATYNGQEVVTWKNQSRSVFDQKALEKQHPALAEKFRKETTTRVMRIKEK
jgi:predicted phage-related endonuclease